MIHTSKQSATRLEKSVIVLYGNGSFSSSSKDEDSVPTGSMKGYFLTRSAGEHRTSRGCPFCQKSDLVPVTANGRAQKKSTLLDWRRCTACSLVGEAGPGEGTARRVMQNDKRAALSTRRGGITEMKGKKQPCDLQNTKNSS